jgi:hypothetical protein
MAQEVDVRKLSVYKQKFYSDLKKVSRHIEKPKPSPKHSKT